jgi:hypothetical protein
MRRAAVGVAHLLLCVTTACEKSYPPGVTVTDSAGVQVTLSTDHDGAYAHLDPAPTISLGGPDATGPTQLFRVQGVLVDPAGRLWIADGQSGELRIFEPDGTHVRTLGGRGEGPGEFEQIRLLGSGPGDTVFVGDGASDRVTVYSPEGELVRTELLASSDRPAPRPFGVFGDGAILGQRPRILAAAALEPGQVLVDSVELVRVELEGSTTQPVGAAQGPLWIWTGRSQTPVPFTANASFAASGAEVHLVSGPDFRVQVHENGELRRIHAVDRASKRVDSADLDAYRAFVEEYVPEAMRPDYLEALEHEVRPDVLPAYDRLLVSTTGDAWAQVYEAEVGAAHEWDVFGIDGRYLGSVHVWSGMHPMAITEDAVVGVWRDELGVEQVRAYSFRN